MASPTACLEPHIWLRRILLLVFGFCAPLTIQAQSVTYHLHREASAGSILQMKSAGPDAAIYTGQSANLKNAANGEYVIKEFDTPSGVPGASGVITAGGAVSFTLWLKKTASAGTMFPRVKLKLNTANGTSICVLTGSDPLTTTLSSYTLSGTVPSGVSMSTNDRFYLWVGINLTSGSSVNNRGELNVEGTLNGNYDSRITIPLPASVPSISNLSPSSGPIGTSTTVAGTNFGATQGSSSITFNGTAATPTSWSATSITVPVPSGVSTGPVVVTVSGQASNGVTFTVTPQIDNLSPTSGAVGTPVTIGGSSFGATQGGSTVTFNGTATTPTSWSATSIAAPVPSGASTGPVVVTVSGQASNGVTFTVTPQIDNLSPASGAVGTPVTISGSSFGATQGSSTVTFNGTATTPTSWSATSIAAPVPSGATTGPVVVTVSGQGSNGVTFTVPPQIDNLSPTSGAVGTPVTISGSSFGATQGSSTVTFNGTTATPTSWSATSIAAPVPSGTSTGPVVVTVNGQASNGVTFTVGPSQPGSVSYVYDGLGRLVGVVDPASDTAIYHYDSVGNLESISRQSSSLVSIIAFSPPSGPIGTSVTIYGTGFSTTPSQNLVTFNGVAGNVTSASATKIVATVPSGASSGSIAVTSPAGSATSSNPFVVSAGNSPTITGFSPTIGTPNTPVTITGTNFDPDPHNDKTRFNITYSTNTSVTPTSINTTVPLGASSGRISVATPNGTAVSSADFFIPPAAHLPSEVGVTGRMSIGDIFNAVIAANMVGMFLFDGTAGQRVSLGMTNVTIAEGVCCPVTVGTVAIYQANGTPLLSPFGFGQGGHGSPSVVLPQDSSYLIVADPLNNWSGGVTLTLSEDLSPPIAIGGPSVALGFNRPGQNGYVSFAGSAGQRVSVGMSNVTIAQGVCCPNELASVLIYSPDGTTLLPTFGFWGSGGGTPSLVLPMDGIYSIEVNPYYNWTGNITLTVSEDLSPPISIGGPSVPLDLNRPGQNGYLTFSGTAGQRVSLGMSDVTIAQGICCPNELANVAVYNPNGTTLLPAFGFWGSGGGTPSFVLPVSGNYSIVVNPFYHWTGNITVTVSEDLSPPIAIGGPSVPLDHRSGQNSYLSFAGTAGQRVSLGMTNVTIAQGVCCPNELASVAIYKPDGTTLLSPYGFGAGGGGSPSVVLPVSGNYSIEVNPLYGWMGNITVTLSEDLSPPIAIGGPSVPLDHRSGQNSYLSFAGTAGQRVSLGMSDVTVAQGVCCPSSVAGVVVYKPDGTIMLSSFGFGAGGGGTPSLVLPVSGNYSIEVNPFSSWMGNVTLTVSEDLSPPINIGDPAIALNFDRIGQNAYMTFSGTASQQVTVRITGNTTGTITVTLLNSGGSTLTSTSSGGAAFNLSTITLPTTGTYAIRVDPSSTNTGAANVAVTSP